MVCVVVVGLRLFFIGLVVGFVVVEGLFCLGYCSFLLWLGLSFVRFSARSCSSYRSVLFFRVKARSCSG